MSTYAFVTKAPAPVVTEAVRAGRTGGYVAADPLGTIVLFDPPPGAAASTRRLVRPARDLVGRAGAAGWLLLADDYLAQAIMLAPGCGDRSLEWVADWEPPTEPVEYLSQRAEWDAFCAEVAADYGQPSAAARLALVRNDPVPGERRPPLGDLLRGVCQAVDLPDVAVGRSLLAAGEPGLFDAHRVDGSAPSGWRRLFARA